MTRIFLATLALAGLLTTTACESVNQGARAVGEPVGGAMRVPNSVSEGAAKGVAGQPNKNPYGR